MNITPEEYELYVKEWFDGLGHSLKSYNSKHRNIIHATDGDYEIDIDITYEVLKVTFRILIECKKYKDKIKREVVQLLHQKIQAIGAHKGIVCSTSGFQSGALKYAKIHGIACIQVVLGETTFHTKSAGPQKLNYDPCEVWGIPRICGYMQQFISKSCVNNSIVSKRDLKYIGKFLESRDEEPVEETSCADE